MIRRRRRAWETGAPKEGGIHCAIETGGMEHELRALVGEIEAGSVDGGEASVRLDRHGARVAT